MLPCTLMCHGFQNGPDSSGQEFIPDFGEMSSHMGSLVHMRQAVLFLFIEEVGVTWAAGVLEPLHFKCVGEGHRVVTIVFKSFDCSVKDSFENTISFEIQAVSFPI